MLPVSPEAGSRGLFNSTPMVYGRKLTWKQLIYRSVNPCNYLVPYDLVRVRECCSSIVGRLKWI